MARNTDYTLYKTGRTDPSFKNIWAFESDTLRTAWLNSCSPLNFPNNKYWRTGATIKCPVRYEESFNYDYVRIINRLGEVDRTKTWFCFITGRTYVSNNCTLFTLAVDYPQTFLFNSDGSPFWKTYGFIETATIENPEPNRGQGAEFPVPAKQCSSLWYDSLKNFSILVYSTVDLTVLMTSGEVAYRSQLNGGVFMASVPFIITGVRAAETFANTISKLNEMGLTDAINGAYCVPSRFFSKFTSDTWTMCAQSNIDTETFTVTPIDRIGEYVPNNKVLLRGDYSVIIVNNCQGESSIYHFEDFLGAPTFKSTVSVISGSPTVMIWPGDNYKYGNSGNFRQHIMKITSPVSCSYLNDNYRIWLAQNNNQRTAALNAAQTELDNANRAAQYALNSHIDEMLNKGFSLLSNLSGGEPEPPKPSAFTQAANRLRYDATAAQATLDRLTGGRAPIIKSISREALTDHVARTGQTIDAMNQINYEQALDSMGSSEVGDFIASLAKSAIRRELGIEHAYVYDNAIATAQANLQKVQAFYADKEVIPSTALGSNAHGDLVLFNQHNFIISVITPTVEWAVKIDKLLSSSGCMVNNLGDVMKRHAVFDYYKCDSPWVLAERNGRPQYVRNMLISLLQHGVYLWYYNNGDISEYIGLPYDISNPPV